MSSIDRNWTRSSRRLVSSGSFQLLSASMANASPAFLLPSSISSSLLTATISGSVNSTTPIATVLALQSGGLLLCHSPTSTDATKSQSLEVLADLTPRVKRHSEVGGLHLCLAGDCGMAEAVIWAAQTNGIVQAISLGTGQVLTTLRSVFPVSIGGRLISLTGNSSHLVAAITSPGRPGSVVISQYPQLPEVLRDPEL
eukprot:TRINITY_DN14605_c0_g1_i1.p1 TRINITY_DN14605_c0_g1~~TRINITY_DN14605_c0_g1_i1.p1  ORF type:complete len:213 (+),score=13.33 TRINITY_DN14605_c0_g1_i1:46-639(+)